MDNLNVLTNERLSKLINETQETLDELKQEVARREYVQQEHEVLDLDSHMKSAELSLTTIRNFIDYVLKDSKRKSS